MCLPPPTQLGLNDWRRIEVFANGYSGGTVCMSVTLDAGRKLDGAEVVGGRALGNQWAVMQSAV